jgi:radical SAM superfamily enzyme YgiQ (UPF0313 family)
MSTKSILVNFAGYPISPRDFVPDNGMASLAGSLIEHGHETIVLDYSTVDIIRRLFPYHFQEELQHITGALLEDIHRGHSPNPELLQKFYRLDEAIDQFQQERVVDIAKEVLEYVKLLDADFVGFKLFVGDAFDGSIAIARYLKEHCPSVRLFAGGPHIDWFRERIFQHTDVFDALAYGEGEETICALAEYVEGKRRLEDISNLLFQTGSGISVTPMQRIINIDMLPRPVYDETIYPAMRGNQKIKIILIDESRGCPNACNFCCHPAKSGNKWRLRSPEQVVDTIEYLQRRYSFSAFRFSGSNPPPQQKKAIAAEILRRGLQVRYTTFSHVRESWKEDFALLHDSGCYAIFFGLESGSPAILKKSMNKRTSIEQVRAAVRYCKESGIKVVGSIIYPAPFETEETKEETLSLLRELRLDSTDICFPTPVLGTQWGDNPQQYGFDIGDTERFWQDVMTYRLKTYYPQILWKPYPSYRLNGKSFSDTAKESTWMSHALEKHGLATQMTDEVLLMAHLAQMDSQEFRDKSNTFLAQGNYAAMEGMAAAINTRITQTHATI